MVSAGLGSDIRITAVAAMTPFLAGMLVLLGYVWLGGFGVLLGIGAAVAWAVWWFRRNDRKFFPRDVDNRASARCSSVAAGAYSNPDIYSLTDSVAERDTYAGARARTSSEPHGNPI